MTTLAFQWWYRFIRATAVHVRSRRRIFGLLLALACAPIASQQTSGSSATAFAIQSSPIVFAIIGDFGHSPQARRKYGEWAIDPPGDVARLVKSWEPEFIVTTGDNNYYCGDADTIDDNIGQYYHAFMAPYLGKYGRGATENRLFPSIGNHDWYAGAGCQPASSAAPYIAYFPSLPGNGRYYDFVRGAVHIFVLSSDLDSEHDGVTASSTQGLWLQSALASSQSPWKLVVFHHPPFSSGICCGDIRLESDWMRWPFQAWGASAVVAGHSHSYERIMIAGFPYFVNGAGGHGTTPFETNPSPGTVVRYNDDLGAMRVIADQATLSFEFINRSGELIDLFKLPSGL
jgi:tartrate-resistant acid phosphatase type 5